MVPSPFPANQGAGSAVDWGSPPARGLAAVWDMGVGAGLRIPDVGSHGFHGTLGAGGGGVFPAFAAGPNGLPALFYSGQANVSCGTIPEMLGQPQLTMTWWAKRSAVNATVYVGFDTNGSNQFNGLLYADGNCYFAVFNGLTTSYGSVALNDAAWHHYAMVFDGTQGTDPTRLVVYRDAGRLSLTFGGGAIPATTTTAGSAFNIGTDTTLSRFGSGHVADVRLSRAALSASEVAEIYRYPARLALPLRAVRPGPAPAVGQRPLSLLLAAPGPAPPPY